MPNDIKKLRRLMKSAHHLQKENPVILKGTPIDQSNALKYAWWFESFRAKLASGVYRFSYFKKDGTIREAKGTLNPEYIPEDKKPKGEEIINPKFEIFNYFDLDRKSWRSFRIDLFIGFVEQVK